MPRTSAMRQLLGLSGMLLTLPLSASSFLSEHDLFGPSHGLEGTPVQHAQGSLGSVWAAYLEAELTPDYAWAQSPAVSRVNAGILAQAGFGEAGMPAAQTLWAADSGRVSVSYSEGGASPVPGATVASVLSVSRPAFGHGLQRTVLAPSLVQPLTDDVRLSVAALFAFQRFASPDPAVSSLSYGPQLFSLRSEETSFGSGLQLMLDAELGERARWQMGFQSRVDMEAFRNYRGLYSEPGKFDIPASGKAGFEVALLDGFSLGFGVQRVFFSDVAPFTTLALPDRFLALLGDGDSPPLAWRDLTVYSTSLGWLASERDHVEFRYSTRQQPAPTSPLLSDALRPDQSNTNLALGWTRDLRRLGSFSVAATYSATEYFLGDLAFRPAGMKSGEQLELEAVWSVRF